MRTRLSAILAISGICVMVVSDIALYVFAYPHPTQ